MDILKAQKVAQNCHHFLSGHDYRSVQTLMQTIADSPLAQKRGDQYGKGGVVSELEERVANLLGKEAAVFMPSGTMAQPIALRIWADTSGSKKVAFHPTCHLEIHEHHAYRELHHLESLLVGDRDALMTLEDVTAIEGPLSTLLIELPQREIGGQLPSWNELSAIADLAHSRGWKVHLDGARLWESAPAFCKSYAEIAQLFDSVYVSFYKILGGLPGAVLAGPSDFIQEARIWQRRHGGNLHQQTPNAISAILGMEKHLPQMSDYVAKAAEISDALRSHESIRIAPEYPPTNMMHLYLKGDSDRLNAAALEVAERHGIWLFYGLGPSGKVEISVGTGAAGLSGLRVRQLFDHLLELSVK